MMVGATWKGFAVLSSSVHLFSIHWSLRSFRNKMLDSRGPGQDCLPWTMETRHLSSITSISLSTFQQPFLSQNFPLTSKAAQIRGRKRGGERNIFISKTLLYVLLKSRWAISDSTFFYILLTEQKPHGTHTIVHTPPLFWLQKTPLDCRCLWDCNTTVRAST